MILFLKYRNKWNKQDSQEFPIYSNKRSYVTRKYATFDDLHKKTIWMHAHRHILVFSNPPPLCEFWNITIIDVYLETPRPEIWNRTCPAPTHTICKICEFESFYHQGLLVQNHIGKNFVWSLAAWLKKQKVRNLQQQRQLAVAKLQHLHIFSPKYRPACESWSSGRERSFYY